MTLVLLFWEKRTTCYKNQTAVSVDRLSEFRGSLILFYPIVQTRVSLAHSLCASIRKSPSLHIVWDEQESVCLVCPTTIGIGIQVKKPNWIRYPSICGILWTGLWGKLLLIFFNVEACLQQSRWPVCSWKYRLQPWEDSWKADEKCSWNVFCTFYTEKLSHRF